MVAPSAAFSQLQLSGTSKSMALPARAVQKRLQSATEMPSWAHFLPEAMRRQPQTASASSTRPAAGGDLPSRPHVGSGSAANDAAPVQTAPAGDAVSNAESNNTSMAFSSGSKADSWPLNAACGTLQSAQTTVQSNLWEPISNPVQLGLGHGGQLSSGDAGAAAGMGTAPAGWDMRYYGAQAPMTWTPQGPMELQSKQQGSQAPMAWTTAGPMELPSQQQSSPERQPQQHQLQLTEQLMQPHPSIQLAGQTLLPYDIQQKQVPLVQQQPLPQQPQQQAQQQKLPQPKLQNAPLKATSGFGVQGHRNSSRAVLKDIWAPSKDSQGTRHVQALFENGSGEERSGYALQLHGHVWEGLRDPHANHVIQACIRTVTPKESEFIVHEILRKGPGANAAARHRYGCRIVERLIEHSNSDMVRPLIEEILTDALAHCTHPFGNYVMQHILEHGDLAHRSRIARIIEPHVKSMGADVHASAVVGKAMTHCAPEDQKLIARALVRESGLISQMARTRHGHVAAKLVFNVLDGQDLEQARYQISPDLQNLRGSRYGRFVALCVEPPLPSRYSHFAGGA